MKQKFTYLFLLPFTLLLAGCPGISDTESDPVPQPDPKPASICRLTSSKNVNDLFDLRYTYNSNNQLTNIYAVDTTGVNIKLTYDAQGRLIQEQEHAVSWDNEYNEKNQLIKQTRTFNFAPDRAEVHYYIHQYSEAGRLEESKYYDLQSPNRALYYFKYQYEGDMITKVEKETYAGNGPILEVITYTYDGQKPAYPLLPLINLYQHFGDDHPVIGMLQGNITSCTIIDWNTGVKSSFSYTISYTYTPEGYPKEATITNGYGTYKRAFGYSCE